MAWLETWMPQQRWYAAKGRTPALRLVAGWDLPDPYAADGETAVRVRTLLVADESAQPATLYQVPVVVRATAPAGVAAEHVIGTSEPGTTLVDGPFDPAYSQALLQLVTRGGGSIRIDDAVGDAAIARGIPSGSAPVTGAYRAERAQRRAVEHVDHLSRRRRRDADHLQGVPAAAPRDESRHRAADGPRRSRVAVRPAGDRLRRRGLARRGRRHPRRLARVRTGVPPRGRGRASRRDACRHLRRRLPGARPRPG